MTGSQFEVYGGPDTGYGVAVSGGIVYDAEPDTDKAEAERLAAFHNLHPDASYEAYLAWGRAMIERRGK